MKQVIIPAVTGLAVRPGGQFLLTKRHQPDAPVWDGQWNIPGGGIDWGESPETALKRELMEELGVTPTILYPHPIPVTALWYGRETGYDNNAHILLLCYLIDIGDQVIDLTLDPEQETSEYRWFTLEEARKVSTLPHTIETISAALELVDKHAILASVNKSA